MTTWKSVARTANGSICVLIASLAGSTAQAVDFYVAPSGNDANPGSQKQPFASLEGARNAVRAWKESGAAAEPVRVGIPIDQVRPRLRLAPVVDPENAHRHDPRRLTQALMTLLDDRPVARPVAPVRSA